MPTAQAIEAVTEAVEAVASKTGVYDREAKPPQGGHRRASDIAVWCAVFLMLGGGGVSLAGLFSDDGTQALAKAAALESKIDLLSSEVSSNARRVEAVETSTDRMLREQARMLNWLIVASQKQSIAIGAVAKAAGVDVDLIMSPLLVNENND